MSTSGSSAVQRLMQGTRTNHGTARGWVRSLLGELEYLSGRLDAHLEPESSSTRRLVFVCLGNINRSAFGEGVARQLGVRTSSLGLATTTGAPAFHKAVETAARFGVDLSRHAATDISDYSYQEGDLLLAMEVRHLRRLVAQGIPARSIVLLGHWSTPRRVHLHDPHTLGDEYFRTCFTLIHSATLNLVHALKSGGSPCLSE
jgi:protein-tyrosine phosphatase